MSRKAVPRFKYPHGLCDNMRVQANKRHDNAYRQTPKGRKGTIIAPTSIPNTVRVHWDGCAHPREIDCRFFDVIKGESNEQQATAS